MCDTDLDLDLEFAEDEQAPDEHVLDEQIPDELAVDGRYVGVAWGLAETDVQASRPR
jgi:hypothetical protein